MVVWLPGGRGHGLTARIFVGGAAHAAAGSSTMTMIRSGLWRLLVIGALAGIPLGAAAQQSGSQSAPPDTTIDKPVIDALNRMGAYLRTLTSFKVHSETLIDAVLEDGQKVQLAGHVDLSVRRPDRLFIDFLGDRKQRRIYYNGKTFTIFAPNLGYYATVPAPGTLLGLVEVLESKFGIEMPLADLFRWGTDQSGIDKIRSAMVIGESTVDGIRCDHFALQQQEVDWQIWIRKGDRPLPCKLVITSKDDVTRPQYISVLTWTPSASFTEKVFAFDPPRDATGIEIAFHE
jgi:hypothetical protein